MIWRGRQYILLLSFFLYWGAKKEGKIAWFHVKGFEGEFVHFRSDVLDAVS